MPSDRIFSISDPHLHLKTCQPPPKYAPPPPPLAPALSFQSENCPRSSCTTGLSSEPIGTSHLLTIFSAHDADLVTVGKQRVNPNSPHCPGAQHSSLRGLRRPSGRNLLSWGDAQPWGSFHHDPPSPKAAAVALLPPSEGSPGPAALNGPHALKQELPGSFLHGIFPRPPKPLASAPWRPTLNFLGESTAGRHQPCLLRDQMTPLFPPHPPSNVTAFSR